MRIKNPRDDGPLRSLSDLLQTIQANTEKCHIRGHDFITIIYISSFVFSDILKINGERLSEKLRGMSNKYGANVVCLIRAASSNTLRYFKWHKKFLDEVRGSCYVIEYSKDREFLNHAKFLIWIHVCLTEDVIYSGKLYGSTNFTQAGMSTNSKGQGNYEEYYYDRYPRIYTLNRIIPRQASNLYFYIDVCRELLEHKVSLYTDVNYIRQMLKAHLDNLREVIKRTQDVLKGTTVLDLYTAYVDSLYIYMATLALLDQLPGKKLTTQLVGQLIKLRRPPIPLLLETLLYSDKIETDVIATVYSREYLIRELHALMRILIVAEEKIMYYQKKLESYEHLSSFIKEYADRTEIRLYERINEFTKKSLKLIKKVQDILKEKIGKG